MKLFTTLVTAGAVVLVASWAYWVNYETRTARSEMRALQAALAFEQEKISVLEVEWAYLNRPERLAALIKQHSDVLGLMPAGPGHFGDVSQVPYPSKTASLTEAPSRPTLPMTLQEALNSSVLY